jgi:hypothetical protein
MTSAQGASVVVGVEESVESVVVASVSPPALVASLLSGAQATSRLVMARVPSERR